jgi:predicted permease
VKSFFSRARRDAELEEEIRAHLEMAERDRIERGEPAARAAAAARREFGNVSMVTELTRQMWEGLWFERLAQDLRYAVRSLRRAPGFTTVAVLTLALGIGANTAMFTVVNGVLLRPLPFPRSERLFLISYKQQSSFSPEPGLSDVNYLEFKSRQHSFENVAVYSGSPVTLTGAGEPVRVDAAVVTPEFIDLLGVAPALGAAFSARDGQKGREPVTLLSDRLWHDRFGADSHVVGKPVMLDGIAHTVIGVMPPGFEFPGHAMLWCPVAIIIDPHNSWITPVIGRLRDGVTEEEARAELAVIAPRLSIPGQERQEILAQVLPLQQVVVGGVARALWIFSGAVAFVLLIACANVANLLLMRASARQEEMSVRTALGAARWRLLRQLLTESALIAVCGGALGVLLAVVGVRALVALSPAGHLPRVEVLHVDATVLAFTAAVSLCTGVVFGLVPALRLTRHEGRHSLNQGTRTSTRHAGLRSAFVVTEIALAIVLLAGAGLMMRSFERMRSIDLGFRPEHVVSMTVDLPHTTYGNAEAIHRFHSSVLDGLTQLPGGEAAGAVNWMPLGGQLIKGGFNLDEGRVPPKGSTWVDKDVVSTGYFRTWGIRLLSGRDFTAHDDAGAPAVVIVSNSVAQRLWPGQSPIGKRITLSDTPGPNDWLTIVGVVDDVVQEGVTTQRNAALYRHYPQVAQTFFIDHMTFAVRTSSMPAVIAAGMRDVLHRVDKDQPIQKLATMEELVSATTAEPLFQARLLGLFSVLALALAAIGIYGVLAYSVAERTREIGIRMALGARAADVARMIVRRAFTLLVPGAVLGVLGALAMTRVLAGLLFGVKPNDPATLVSVTALLGVVALLAAWIPARRAARVDPQIALRAE